MAAASRWWRKLDAPGGRCARITEIQRPRRASARSQLRPDAIERATTGAGFTARPLARSLRGRARGLVGAIGGIGDREAADHGERSLRAGERAQRFFQSEIAARAGAHEQDARRSGSVGRVRRLGPRARPAAEHRAADGLDLDDSGHDRPAEREGGER